MTFKKIGVFLKRPDQLRVRTPERYRCNGGNDVCQIGLVAAPVGSTQEQDTVCILVDSPKIGILTIVKILRRSDKGLLDDKSAETVPNE